SPRAGGVNHPDRAIQSIPRKSSPGTGDPIVTLTFTWRRQARRLPTPMADDPPFVSAVVDAVIPAVAVGHERKQRDARPSRMSGLAVAMPRLAIAMSGASRSRPKASLSGPAEARTWR
ncbi:MULTISPECIES: hypothetical protein, partial [unclassified Bradyrhizobium]|uniref:hypothetical protein n=1 Tax=unclassified Bradyrhizobium TaxID=2631580 RepID=UPI001FF9F79C